jgi:arsenate reductase
MIRNAGIEPVIIHYLEEPPSREQLRTMIAAAGLSVREALREKGTPYHELGLENPSLTDDQLLDAMLGHPILINRPFVVTEQGTRLCRPSEVVLEILPQPQRGGFTKEDGEVVVDEQGRRVGPGAIDAPLPATITFENSRNIETSHETYPGYRLIRRLGP